MSYRIAINGYGRIGQSVVRALYSQKALADDLQLVAINDLADLGTLTYLTRYDTTHGRFPERVENDGETLLINRDPVAVYSETDPARLPWDELDVDLLLECSGSYSDRQTAEVHLASGAKRLLFSQPAADDIDATIIYGFNHEQLKSSDRVVSSASCTSNCAVPVLALLDRHFTIDSVVTTTTHSVMNDQPLIDRYHSHDLRLTRSAMVSLVPVRTALHQGIVRFLPHLQGRIEALHLRVPTINVSLMDLSIQVAEEVTSEQVNALFRQAAGNELRGLLGYSEEPHASVDFNGDPRSAIVDGSQTRVAGGQLIKLMVWFDNEWSYARRMLDVSRYWLNL